MFYVLRSFVSFVAFFLNGKFDTKEKYEFNYHLFPLNLVLI